MLQAMAAKYLISHKVHIPLYKETLTTTTARFNSLVYGVQPKVKFWCEADLASFESSARILTACLQEKNQSLMTQL